MRDNNFDFLRLLGAVLVLVSHQYALSGRPEPLMGAFSFGTCGVLIFFSISGFLIAESWSRDPNAWRFWTKRFLRIVPGLLVVIALAAFALGPVMSTEPLEEYFSSPLHFIPRYPNGRYELPGMFEDNPLPKAINGSLWTIPVEVAWYFVLFSLALVGALRRRFLVLVVLLVFGGYCAHVFTRETEAVVRLKAAFGVCFLAGVALHAFRQHVTMHVVVGGASLAALVLASAGYAWAAMLVSLPPAVIAIGRASTPVLRRFGRFGDLSYGIYIYAFPVQQAVVALTDNGLGIAEGLLITSPVTAALAFASWHLVERPSLELKGRLSRTASGPAAATVRQ